MFAPSNPADGISCTDAFQSLLLELADASAKGAEFAPLLRRFCEATRQFFAADGACCWTLADGELLGVEAVGALAESFRGTRVPLSESTIVAQVVRNRRTMYVNDLSQAECAISSRFHARAVMATPLIVAGEVLGALAFVSHSMPQFFTPEMAARASILGSMLGSVLEARRLRQEARDDRRRAEHLKALSLELNSSLRQGEFLQDFTRRAAEMMAGRAGLFATAQRRTIEVAALHGPKAQVDSGLLRRLSFALTEWLAHHPENVFSGAAASILGPGSESLTWTDLALVRVIAANGELLGVLGVADRGLPLTNDDANLLKALAGHASVALENARLFTRMEQANRHWIQVFDAITDYIVVHDESNRVLRANRSLAELMGVRPNDLIGVTMRALVTMAADGSEQPCPFCRVGADGVDEYLHPALERTYLVSTSRVVDPGDEGVQTIHVLKDITDRREAERRYRELFDTIQEGLFFSTPEGRFVEVNDALVRILGYESRDQLLQVDIASEIYMTADQRLLFTQQIAEHGAVRNWEELLRRKDGSPIHTLQNAFAVRDAAGNVVQYRGLILDITELKNFQTELQRQRDFNSKILNNTQSMILVADTAGLISYANRRCYEAGGYDNGQLLGRRLLDLSTPGRRQSLSDALNATLSGQQVDNLELPITLGKGGVGQFSINMSPMRDEAGTVNSLVVVMTDITDAAMLQAKLMHTEKMAAVGQLVSGVAHEVNNPLTAILGFSDLLLDRPEISEDAKHDLRVIMQEAQRTKQIVQNLLSFARQMPPQRQPLELNPLLRRTLALRSYDFSSHGVEVMENLEEKLPPVIGDAPQLQQVFLNIINNAYDAVRETTRQGRMEITTRGVGEVVEISFSDNGNGITYPERIFDPFFTTKEVGKGTGLGLSICYGIVHEHGGEITCQNNLDAPGATFVVRLPAVVPQSEIAAGVNS